MSNDSLKFEGYNLFVKNLKDGGHRVEIEVSHNEYNKIKDIPNLPEGVYKITIEPIIE